MLNYKKVKIYLSSEFSSEYIIKEHLGENTTIPIDDSLLEYQKYLAWLAEGNEPEVVE
jgi:hypothetical protein